MQRARPAIPASPFKQWLTLKKANTRAKAKMIVRARADVRPATPVAKPRTLAKAREAVQLTEANRLKHNDKTLAAYFSGNCGSCVRGPEFSNSRPGIRNRRAEVHFS
jgi:hypothetical protein